MLGETSLMKIIDNITTPANAAHLKHLLLGEPWYYLKSTAYNDDDSTGGIPFESSWILMIYDNKEIMSPLMHLAHSILVKALHQQNLTMSELIRIRAGFTTRTPEPFTHAPHVDWDVEHMSGLYYLNDSDGDTIFYNDKQDPGLEESSFDFSQNREFTVDQTVTPKADRFVLFDGDTFHSSTSPTKNDYRLVLNYNWLP
jgi:hypothetical protein